MRQSLKFEAVLVNGRATTQFDHPLQPFRHRVFAIGIFGSIPAGIPQARTSGVSIQNHAFKTHQHTLGGDFSGKQGDKK